MSNAEIYNACVDGQRTKVASIIAKQGRDVLYTRSSGCGYTPLHGVCRFGTASTAPSMVAFLLNTGGPELIFRKDFDGGTPLHCLVYSRLQEEHPTGVLTIANLLYQKGGVNVIHAMNSSGRTPLHRACQQNFTAVTVFLLEKGASMTATDNRGRTPLHISCYGGNVANAKILLEKGGTELKFCQDHMGETPLHSTCHHGHLPHVVIAEFLMEYGGTKMLRQTDVYGRTVTCGLLR